MKILIVTSWATDVLGGSGTAVFFNNFLAGLRGRGFEVEVIAPNFDVTDYIEVTLRRFLFNAELRTDPRIQSADVIIGLDYDGYALDPANRPPLIASAHAVYGDVLQWESGPARTMVQAQAFFDQVSMRQADHVTAGSQYAKDRIVQHYGVEPDRIKVIPHGLTRSPWMDDVESTLREPNDHPIILAVGKMYPRKRFDLLLKAVPMLRGKYPSLEVRIVGDGLEFDRLREMADQMGIGAHVTWLARMDSDQDFAREWRQADIFCHPSSQETFGFVYVEAMSLGKAIVATTASTAPEVVGNAGFLVEPGNPRAIAHGIDYLLSHPEAARTFGERGRQRAAAYTVERMIDGYTRLIADLTAPTRMR